MGGLAAAKAVAPFFGRVVVIDRDALPDAPAPRIGTPQTRHVHVLLAGGEQALERLFPGFRDDLERAGAVTIRDARDFLLERPGYDPFPRRDLGFDVISASRPMIERLCRRRLEQDPKVEIRSRSRAIEVAPSPDRRDVAGLRIEDAEGAVADLAADLVVDASGRALPTLAFLERIGAPKPEETVIGIDVGYASTIFEPPAEARDWLGVIHMGAPPDEGKGGLILPIENGRWLVSLGRRPSGEMPTDVESFVAFTKSLRTQTLYRALRTAKPLTDIARFGFPASVRRHFHTVDGWPRGLVPIGDSICRFNPLFGQGMSVAALEAAALGRLLDARAGSADPLAGLGQEFLVQIQDLLEAPWGVAVSDFAYAHTTGERPHDLEQRLRFTQAIVRLAAEDPDVHKLMVEVGQLLKSPSVLREPPIRERAMALMAATAA
jgi:2-polyprenyl-6-methoxyphenol hydroxylase-like FAD-dependent oxidoreductase